MLVRTPMNTIRRILAMTLFTLMVNSSLSADRPNILFAIADDWSFGHAGAYGCGWVETPNFDRLANEGILFQNAYTPNAKCAPSRATILTGRYSWQLEQAGNHMAIFPPKFGGFVERLADAGYQAGYTGKGWGPGIAKDANGKQRAITGKRYAKHKLQAHASGIASTDYAANFKEFFDESPKGKPWVFWYGTTEPHRGYEYGSGVRLGKRLDQIDRVPAYWQDNEITRNDMLDYAIEVEHYDQQLGSILAIIEAAGQLANTLVVATSDHGMPFPRVKGQAYEHSNHIPLAMRWPAGIQGKKRLITDHVNFTDLAPTFLQAAGISECGPIMQAMSGQGLFDIFSTNRSGQISSQRSHVIVGKERHDTGRPNDWGYPIRGISKDGWLYIKNFEPSRWPAGNPETGYLNCDGSPIKSNILSMRRSGKNQTFWDLNFGKRPTEELYDLGSDPDCVNNLASSATHKERKAALATQMISDLTEQGDPRMSGQGKLFDDYPYSDGRTGQFYQKYLSGNRPRAGWVNESDFETDPID